MRQQQLYRIRELARRCGVSTRTIDYYTQLGLIEPADRSNSNYRLYDETAASRLRLIKALQTQRLSLQEIRDRLADRWMDVNDGERRTQHVLDALQRIGSELASVERELCEIGATFRDRGALDRDARRMLTRTANDAMLRALAVAQVLGTLASENLVGRGSF